MWVRGAGGGGGGGGGKEKKKGGGGGGEIDNIRMEKKMKGQERVS